jgi:hypothetical protein
MFVVVCYVVLCIMPRHLFLLVMILAEIRRIVHMFTKDIYVRILRDAGSAKGYHQVQHDHDGEALEVTLI